MDVIFRKTGYELYQNCLTGHVIFEYTLVLANNLDKNYSFIVIVEKTQCAVGLHTMYIGKPSHSL